MTQKPQLRLGAFMRPVSLHTVPGVTPAPSPMQTSISLT